MAKKKEVVEEKKSSTIINSKEIEKPLEIKVASVTFDYRTILQIVLKGDEVELTLEDALTKEKKQAKAELK